MNKHVKILSLLFLVVIIIICLFIVIFMNGGRYIRAQEFDCDYLVNSYNITDMDLDKMPFIEEIINADGNDVYISEDEYDDLIAFIEKYGSTVELNETYYELQIRMS